MAHCPNCNKKLHIWNIKAECPHCKINIPNHNWEENLEKDAQLREEAFFKMHTALNKRKFAVAGNPFRILRFIFSFLPIIGYIVPLANVSFTPAEGEAITINGFSVLSLFLNKSINIGDIFALLSGDTKQAGIMAVTVLGLLALSLLVAVIAFFFVPCSIKNLRTPAHAVLHALSIVLYVLSPVMLPKFLEAYEAVGLGSAAGSAAFGIYIGIALYIIAFVFDIINTVKPLKESDGKYIPTDDDLQREYAISIGAITEDEYPPEKKKAKKNNK